MPVPTSSGMPCFFNFQINLTMIKTTFTFLLSFLLLSPAIHSQCWKVVTAGDYHTLAIKPDGTLWAWGGNGNGQLGDGTNISKCSPVQIGSASDWETIVAGDYHALAIKTDGSLWAWGDNSYGQLGDDTQENKNSPVQIGTATDWKSVVAGSLHSLAIKTDGTLWAWGWNGTGQHVTACADDGGATREWCAAAGLKQAEDGTLPADPPLPQVVRRGSVAGAT